MSITFKGEVLDMAALNSIWNIDEQMQVSLAVVRQAAAQQKERRKQAIEARKAEIRYAVWNRMASQIRERSMVVGEIQALTEVLPQVEREIREAEAVMNHTVETDGALFCTPAKIATQDPPKSKRLPRTADPEPQRRFWQPLPLEYEDVP